MEPFDVIVIGGGHAGAEATALASRMGARVLLLTQNLETIGQMSCNPAIGGIAKGTVVREVDALGGIMGRATDRARVQFRMLNRSKGPAVWSPRAQCDRGLYRRAVRTELERLVNARFAQGTVARLVIEAGEARGVETTDGRVFRARSVVLTAGTFLRGKIHIGLSTQIAAGRAGEPPAVDIAQDVERQGVTVERFKTGTPPRIDGRSVDLAALERQDGDPGEYSFSHYARESHPAQLPCYLGHTGPRLREIIETHLEQSAMYGGAISGRGPRYCPSIEDKIVRFPDAARHQVFLEPEGLDTTEMYVNGLSTSLPPGVQIQYLRSISGLERVEMTRPGYAIEYDYYPPTQLTQTLELRSIPGLFFAGQVNGTTGYEEAAGQGVVAGINAAARALGRDPVVFGRESGFIGILVDDLVTRGVDEPYRLFTSRSEFRLVHRQDNALRRLSPLAERLGLLSSEELAVRDRRVRREDEVVDAAVATSIRPDEANAMLTDLGESPLVEPVRIAELVRRPRLSLAGLLMAAGVGVTEEDSRWGEIELRYAGYIERERVQAGRVQEMDGWVIPAGVDFSGWNSISFEAREKLTRQRPATLGQAARIPGVSPSDIQALAAGLIRVR
ncbi:MAG: tRNA uridine-5-carboxymethylaminomethyl(34) synthesis enzyme MnmG [Gemmatimonadales bacterium]